MILKSFLLGNLLSLCMKIINSVVVVGLYYGFLTTFSIGPSYIFLLRARVMEEGTEKEVSATTGFITGQLMMFISIYYAPLHLALGRPHTITVLVLPYLLFHFFWNNHKNFFYYGSTTRNSMRNLSIQCVFLNNLIFQLFNHFILPSSTLARLVNIYMFRCNNKMLFVTSSFVGWLIGHILFMKWVGLVLFWIRQNYSIRSNNKYLVSELRNSMARIFSILLFITCVYYLGRMPSPIVTKKLKETSETEERKEENDVETTYEEDKDSPDYEDFYLDTHQDKRKLGIGKTQLKKRREKGKKFFLVRKTYYNFSFRLKTMESTVEIYKKGSIRKCYTKGNVTIFFLYMPKEWKTNNIFYISTKFINFFRNDRTKNFFVHDRKTIPRRLVKLLGSYQWTKKIQLEQGIDKKNKNSRKREGISCFRYTRKKDQIMQGGEGTRILVKKVRSFFEWTLSRKNKKIRFTCNHERFNNFQKGFRRNGLDKKDSKSLLKRFSRIRTSKEYVWLKREIFIEFDWKFLNLNRRIIFRTRATNRFRKSNKIFEIYIRCNFNRSKRSNNNKKEIYWNGRNQKKGFSLVIQIDRRFRRRGRRKRRRIDGRSRNSFKKRQTRSNLYGKRSKYKFQYKEEKYKKEKHKLGRRRSGFDTLLTTIGFSPGYNQRIHACSKTKNSYWGNVSSKCAFSTFSGSHRQNLFFFVFGYLGNDESHFEELGRGKPRIANFLFGGGRDKRKRANKRRERRRKRTNSNIRSLGYLYIYSSNKRFNVSNPIFSEKIRYITLINNSKKYWPYVIIAIPRMVRGFEGMEKRNACKMYLKWRSIIRNRISPKLVNRRYSDKDSISFLFETLAKIKSTISSKRKRSETKEKGEKRQFLFFNSLGKGSRTTFRVSPKTTFFFGTHFKPTRKKNDKSKKAIFSSYKGFQRKKKRFSKSFKRKNKNSSSYKPNNERTGKSKSHFLIEIENGKSIGIKRKRKRFQYKKKDYPRIDHSNAIRELCKGKLFTHRNKNERSCKKDNNNEDSNRKNHKRQEKNSSSLGWKKIGIKEEYFANVQKKKYPSNTKITLFYEILRRKKMHGYITMYHKDSKGQCTTFLGINKKNYQQIHFQRGNKSRRNGENKKKYNELYFDYKKSVFQFFQYQHQQKKYEEEELRLIFFVSSLCILQIITKSITKQVSFEICTSISPHLSFSKGYNQELLYDTRNIRFQTKTKKNSKVWNEKMEKLVKGSLSIQFISDQVGSLSTKKMAKKSQSMSYDSKERLNEIRFIEKRKRPINSLHEKKLLCSELINKSKRKSEKTLWIKSFVIKTYKLCEEEGLVYFWINITSRGQKNSIKFQYKYTEIRIILKIYKYIYKRLSRKRIYYRYGQKYGEKIFGLENSSFLSEKEYRYGDLGQYAYRHQDSKKRENRNKKFSKIRKKGSFFFYDSSQNQPIQSKKSFFRLDRNESRKVISYHIKIKFRTLVFPRICTTFRYVKNKPVDHTNQITYFKFSFLRKKYKWKRKDPRKKKKKYFYISQSKRISRIRKFQPKKKQTTRSRRFCIRSTKTKQKEKSRRRLHGSRYQKRQKEKTIQEQERSGTGFLPEKIFSFSIKMGRFLESKNDQQYQGILSPTQTDRPKGGNCYILNSKRRDASGCNVDSEKPNSYRIDKKRNIYYRTHSFIYEKGWKIYYISNHRYFIGGKEKVPNKWKMHNKKWICRKKEFRWIHCTTQQYACEKKQKSFRFPCSRKYSISQTSKRIKNFNLFQFPELECCESKSTILQSKQHKKPGTIFKQGKASKYKYRCKKIHYIKIVSLAQLSIRRFSLYESLLVRYQKRESFQYVKNTYVSTIQNELIVYFLYIYRMPYSVNKDIHIYHVTF
nr:hypothetical chloroplast RF19 [Dracaena cinnabari]